VCDYEFIITRLVALREQFGLGKVIFDPWNATHIQQRLEAEGFACEKFPQTISHFTGPTKEFERLLVSRGIKHNGHPLLGWQAGHCQVTSDANQNLRPVKPKHGDVRTIDGMVAGIMGLSGAMQHDGGSFYDDNELESG
jgi:phage terminase large subunit-like protein